MLSNHSKPLRHLVIEKAFAREIGLNPLSINNELGNSLFASVFDYFFDCPGSVFNIDVGVSDFVAVEETFGFSAVGAPGSGIDSNVHAGE